MGVRQFLQTESASATDRVSTLSFLETAVELEAEDQAADPKGDDPANHLPVPVPASWVAEENDVERPKTLVSSIVEILFKEDAQRVIKNFDDCRHRFDNEVKEPTREQIFIGARNLQMLCYKPNKEWVTQNILSSMLIDIDRFVQGCSIFQKDGEIITRRIEELAKHYRVVLNDIEAWMQREGLVERQGKQLLGEFWGEVIDQFLRDFPTTAAIPSIKASMNTFKELTTGQAASIIERTHNTDPQTFMKQLYQAFTDDWKEMTDIVAAHMGDVCHSYEVYRDSTNEFIRDFNAFLYDATGVLGNDEWP